MSEENPPVTSSSGSKPTPDEIVSRTPPLLPDHPPLFRHLDPAAALAFRTPLQEHPPAADTKAAAILTALGIMFPLMAKFGPQLSPLLWGDVETKASIGAIFGTILTWSALLAFVICSLLALIQVFRTLSPRLRQTEPSLAFFGDIAALSRDDYVNRVINLSHDEALRNIVVYNHNLSKICVDKFGHLAWAIKLFKGAFAAWFVLILLIGLQELY